jgi:uncharacterized protein YvpB
MSSSNRLRTWQILIVSLLALSAVALLAGVWLLSKASGNSAIGTAATQTPIVEDTVTATPRSTATPFLPQPTDTATLTLTPSPTATRTRKPTRTASATPSETPLPSPTETPEGGLPPSASVTGVYGYMQSHNLSCESRSAVDWARYYGVNIGEDEFQASLPLAMNPNHGFVGNVDDAMGQIPPLSYGVYSAPVAKTLQTYGLDAVAHKGYTFRQVKEQVASGNPVIVWVIGNTWTGYSVPYTLPNGRDILVAPFEHTAIVVGYDEYGVTLVDNAYVYWRSTAAFLDSWGVLGNMAVTTR